jgi:hypothetical protein
MVTRITKKTVRTESEELKSDRLKNVDDRCNNKRLYPFVKTATVRRCCCQQHMQKKCIPIIILFACFLGFISSQQDRERTTWGQMADEGSFVDVPHFNNTRCFASMSTRPTTGPQRLLFSLPYRSVAAQCLSPL